MSIGILCKAPTIIDTVDQLNAKDKHMQYNMKQDHVTELYNLKQNNPEQHLTMIVFLAQSIFLHIFYKQENTLERARLLNACNIFGLKYTINACKIGYSLPLLKTTLNNIRT